MKMARTLEARKDLAAATGMVMGVGNALREALSNPSVKDHLKSMEAREEAFKVLWKMGIEITQLLEPHRIPE